MYAHTLWAPAFLEWANQQPDWTGPLARAVWAMADWQGGSADAARAIVTDIGLATPPLADTTWAGLDLELTGMDGGVGADFFANAYNEAYGILAGNGYIYGAFYNDLDTYFAQKKSDQAWKREGGDPDEAPDVSRFNVWIQPVNGEPVIIGASSNTDSDVWYAATDDMLAAVAAINEANLKEADDGEDLEFFQWNNLILIGSGHDRGNRTVCESYGVSGNVVIEKGSTFSTGSLTFTGAHDRDAVRAHVAAFSQKRCRFA